MPSSTPVPPVYTAVQLSSTPRDRGLHSERRSQLAAGASNVTLTVHRVLAGYSVTLAAVSVICYTDSEYLLAAVCDAMAVAVLLCSILSNVGTAGAPKKGEPAYTRWMIGIHLGMLLPPLFVLAAAYSWSQQLLNLSTTRRATAFWLAIISSALALLYIIKLRPRKDKQADAGLV